MNILGITNLKKHIGKNEIIRNVNLNINKGEILGLLGKNGAGKTTIIRMIVGLMKPTDGTISIMGYNVQENIENALAHVGCIVENPDLYGYMTGRENLIQVSRMYKNINKNQIEKIINNIGLNDHIDKKVKTYSLGMKQRLGLGQTLLSNPKLLILDEPTNGLDPIGIIEFRETIKNIAQDGTAILISSHILSEIQNVCTKVAFINDGEIKSIDKLNDPNLSLEKKFINIIGGGKINAI
ncbi:ABC transporter ATP-binding protein [Clostridium botulinum]|uniref:ABC transporter ATP-binding protein n=1 Tax=Clostridium botulinum TaxID=1491 RepID=UPI000A17206B|nr:ABC transporter ATP-binding protein [Clostridium botulinum]AUN09401.1 ABC transporter [Clostridium botulinum]OSA72554.1 ABC transporter [Clostridium botulinum]